MTPNREKRRWPSRLRDETSSREERKFQQPNPPPVAPGNPVGANMENVKLKRFLALAAIITLINGVSYTLVPGALLPNYGLQVTSAAVLGFRLFGAALLAFGLILWFLRESREWIAIRGLLIGASVGNIAGLIVSAWATIRGVMNGAGWLFVLTYGLLLLGYAYSLWQLSRKHAGEAAHS
jgi:hypothetical protein